MDSEIDDMQGNIPRAPKAPVKKTKADDLDEIIDSGSKKKGKKK